ncbi:hypothetical protein DFS34DRAFT_620525 [Phlyctochytrium arcticum]|nr:hypothetical protein DFS34DRAFT_620525 [Phlyctochytrium arcticum]
MSFAFTMSILWLTAMTLLPNEMRYPLRDFTNPVGAVVVLYKSPLGITIYTCDCRFLMQGPVSYVGGSDLRICSIGCPWFTQ